MLFCYLSNTPVVGSCRRSGFLSLLPDCPFLQSRPILSRDTAWPPLLEGGDLLPEMLLFCWMLALDEGASKLLNESAADVMVLFWMQLLDMLVA
ncbi:hypothetical protein Nepgr_033749 [Nepenthes gracilis]|uniref:Uncharacterized protein n=1 Tax=Nepenthes gracilis TaxID=150966 RepID=A0AAD3Y8L4_NEPGR|nr:hypothetical protein Nepgr_033749 [Nepenthes gracilis]